MMVLDPHFVSEQAVQHAIALIQKQTGMSALYINVPAIRHLVQAGQTPAQIAKVLVARVVTH